ncbi:MAG: hypothetical protein FWH08_05345 [Oscillospiraceae bacterium]|nr:hypothetical protein [Oscillospiraceae bacterium]
MKAAKITVRILVILLTSVCGAVFGILVPVFLMGGDSDGAMRNISVIWIIMSLTGYFAPCFLVMLDFPKLAIAFSLAGTALTLYLHSAIAEFYTASYMYLPQIFMTVLTVLYFFAVNPQLISGANQKRRDKLNAPAPSILDPNTRKE